MMMIAVLFPLPFAFFLGFPMVFRPILFYFAPISGGVD
jgi:hypothetical protein